MWLFSHALYVVKAKVKTFGNSFYTLTKFKYYTLFQVCIAYIFHAINNVLLCPSGVLQVHFAMEIAIHLILSISVIGTYTFFFAYTKKVLVQSKAYHQEI